ncbi:hypothetical protein IFM89_039964 [Coptis chinensis]|uniref:Uncharacterized protein n=1 Tax=Coptis chinensis TaxID=261450 RepID=A0A835GVP0_9MAGN|nr:hypothetical protein IFM89_039964 [Coptis chinensis]
MVVGGKPVSVSFPTLGSASPLQREVKRDGLPTLRERIIVKSFTVGHVSARPARDGRAQLLILRNSELSYEQRSGAINKKEELLEQAKLMSPFSLSRPVGFPFSAVFFGVKLGSDRSSLVMYEQIDRPPDIMELGEPAADYFDRTDRGVLFLSRIVNKETSVCFTTGSASTRSTYATIRFLLCLQGVTHGTSSATPEAEVPVQSFRQATINEPSLSPIANLAGVSRIARSGRCYISEEVERKRKGSCGLP